MKRYHFCYLLIIAHLFVSCRKDNHNSDNTGACALKKVER